MPLVNSLSEVGTNIRKLYGPRIQSSIGLLSQVGDMALGKQPIDPVLAAKATLLSSLFSGGGGGASDTDGGGGGVGSVVVFNNALDYPGYISRSKVKMAVTTGCVS